MLILALLAALSDSNVSFTGEIRRGDRYERAFGDRFVFALAPDEWGWTIEVLDRERAGVDLASITTPVHGINDRMIWGWFCRDRFNTGPNLPDSANVYAPMDEHAFAFSPWTGVTVWDEWTNRNWAAYDGETSGVFDLGQDGRGVLRVKVIELGNLEAEGEREAWVERMTFEVDLTWRSEALDTSLATARGAGRAIDFAKRVTALELDSGLEGESFSRYPLGAWLSRLARTDSISWLGMYEPPEAETGGDSQFHVLALAELPDARRVGVRIFVGGRNSGIRKPQFRIAWVDFGEENAVATGLADLARLLRDPYRAHRRSADSDRTGMERFRMDLDGDGRDDLFLGSRAKRGTGGNVFNVYLVRPDGYRFLGEIGVERLERLPVKTNGLHDLLCGWKLSSWERNVSIFRFDGRMYVALDERTVRLDPDLGLEDDYPSVPVIEFSGATGVLWGPADDGVVLP